MQERGDGLGEGAGVDAAGGGQGLVTGEAVAGDAVEVEEAGVAAEGELREDGPTEAGRHEALDGLGVVGLHDDARREANFVEEGVDFGAHVAAGRVEDEGDPRQFLGLDVGDVAAADGRRGGFQDEQFLFVKRGEARGGRRHRGGR